MKVARTLTCNTPATTAAGGVSEGMEGSPSRQECGAEGESLTVAPERSPGLSRAERGHVAPQRPNGTPGGAMQGSRWERLWRAVAPLLGLTLHQAAKAAHVAREALGRLQLAVARSLRGLRFLGLLVGLGWRSLRNRKRCDSCGRRLRAGSTAELCDRCAAAALPALRLKVAQLEAALEEHQFSLTDAYLRASDAESQRDQAQSGLAAEFESLGGAIESAHEMEALAWGHVVLWKALFLKALALAVHQRARVVCVEEERNDASAQVLELMGQVEELKKLWEVRS